MQKSKLYDALINSGKETLERTVGGFVNLIEITDAAQGTSKLKTQDGKFTITITITGSSRD